jgi:rhodanese-related sulfurtransferase
MSFNLVKLKQKFLSFLLITIGLFQLVSCQQSTDFDITADQFLKEKDEANVTILDVRTENEYNNGHVENAILMSLRASDFSDKIRDLNKDHTYYVYCRSGGRSRSAVNKMRKEGFSSAYNIKGGILQLKRKGIELVK